MNPLNFSFIIPVYNRPTEVEELLYSITQLSGNFNFEVVIIEDGSNESSMTVVDQFLHLLNISYFFKENSGPGDSRNYGMKRAKGNYFIILDSDCLLPANYLVEVHKGLQDNYVDCFGGPDAAHASFSALQKAINFAMTSFIATGGIRGSKKQLNTFQPRSFNMGLSKLAFEASNGFGNIHPGEDPDLSIRLWKLGFKTALFRDAYVYHKRRISWRKFYKQVYKFGLVRPILNKRYPKHQSLVFWFPSLFCLGLFVSLLLTIYGFYIFIVAYLLYFITAFVLALVKEQSLKIAIFGLLAIGVQFFGYGYGFLKSTLTILFFNKTPEQQFPELFYKVNE